MFAASDLESTNQSGALSRAAAQCHALIDDEGDPIANMANCAALIFNSVPRLNWAGFYLLKGGELVLGPFQGQPACVRIALGAGSVAQPRKRTSTLRVRRRDEIPRAHRLR